MSSDASMRLDTSTIASLTGIDYLAVDEARRLQPLLLIALPRKDGGVTVARQCFDRS